ncbi:group 1 glycosyl transferase [Pseudomonas putida]|uniref:group 1 glycosyl transferase n=1 Tax=Pseudomonas sp. BNK-30 TaxID=3376165 RepID=UPI000E6A9B12
MKQILAELAQSIIAEPSLEHALELAQHYGNLCWTMNVGIYDNPALEQELAKRLKAESGPFKMASFEGRDTLHVVSEPYLTGGHTRLMEKLAGMHDVLPDLMITRPTHGDVAGKVASYFSQTYRADAVTAYIERVRYMVSVMASYERVVLHIHPDDITTVVASILAKELSGTCIYLVNHADHTFTFGSAAADVYFELSSYGRRVDQEKNISGCKSFLGIPVKMPAVGLAEGEAMERAKGDLLFLSAGSDTKFKPRRGADLRPLIRALLNEFPAARFVVIGPNLLRNVWWWPMKIRFAGRLKLMRHLPFDEYTQVARKASFFVDSHPFPGGTAFAEQLLAGQRCVGLVSPFQGYSPADKVKSVDPAGVINRVANYQIPTAVIEQVVCVNGYEHVKKRYLDCLYKRRYSANLLDEYCQWTGDICFMQADEGARNVDVSAKAFLGIARLAPVSARAVFLRLQTNKKIKLMAKLLLQEGRRLVLGKGW